METTSCDLDGSATSDIRFNVSRLVGRKRGVRILHSDSRSAIPRGSGLRLRGRRGIRRRDRLRRRGWSDRTVRRHGGLGGLDGSGLVGSRSDRRGGRLRSRARCRSRPTRLRLLNGGRESSCRSRLRLDGRRLRRIRHPNGRRHGIAGRNGRSRLNRNASRSHGSATGRLNRNGRRLRSRTSGRRGLNRSAGRSGRRAAGRLDRNGGARLSRNGSRLDTRRASHTSRNGGLPTGRDSRSRLNRSSRRGRSGGRLRSRTSRNGGLPTGRDSRSRLRRSTGGSRGSRTTGRNSRSGRTRLSRNGGLPTGRDSRSRLNRSSRRGRSGGRLRSRTSRSGSRLSGSSGRLDTQRASHTSRNGGLPTGRDSRSRLRRSTGGSRGSRTTGRNSRSGRTRLSRNGSRLDTQRASHTSRNGGHVRGGIRGSFPARHGRRGDGHAGLGT